MNRKIVISYLVVLLSFSSTSLAHNGVAHKGKPIEGRAVAVEATAFKVKMEAGEKFIELNKDTVFEIGMDGKKGTQADLKEGSYVMVEGTTLESGVVVATEVMVHNPESLEPPAIEHTNH